MCAGLESGGSTDEGEGSQTLTDLIASTGQAVQTAKGDMAKCTYVGAYLPATHACVCVRVWGWGYLRRLCAPWSTQRTGQMRIEHLGKAIAEAKQELKKSERDNKKSDGEQQVRLGPLVYK
jgi:hypothetical protein